MRRQGLLLVRYEAAGLRGPEHVSVEQPGHQSHRIRADGGRPGAAGRRRDADRAGRVLRGRAARAAGRPDVGHRGHGGRHVVPDGRAARLSSGRGGRRVARRLAHVPRDTVRRVLRARFHVPGGHAAHIRRAARAPRHRPLGQSDRAHRLPVRVVHHVGCDHTRRPHVQLLRLRRRR